MLLYFEIFKGPERLSLGKIEAPFDLGRQSPSELDQTPVFVSESDGIRKLVFVPLEEKTIPRKAIRVALSIDGSLVVQNIHHELQARLSDGRSLAPGGELRSLQPVSFVFDGGYRARFSISDPELPSRDDMEASYRLRQPSLSDLKTAKDMQHSLLQLSNDDDQLQAVSLIKSALRAFKEVPGTDSFFRSVVTSVLEMIDVEAAFVLVRRTDSWEQLATAFYTGRENRTIECRSDPSATVSFSRTLLQRVLDSRATVIIEPDVSEGLFTESMFEIQRAVASPIFDERREIVAVLYADKRVGGLSDTPIGDVEAALLEVLASGVSSGLLRQKDEAFRAEAARFFSPRVLERIRDKKDLLEGRDAEVSVLFCDVRGFSATSHRIGPTATISWINDVFTSLSESVLRHDGVVVNYVGDELIAMFGAPEEQLDHAERAYRTAQDMISSLPELNAKWCSTTNSEFGVGIGINTGLARVGNTGSRLKFQYGPLGNTVNIASRVQSITKLLGVPGLMTGETAKGLLAPNLIRRLLKVRVVGVPDPIELFEVQSVVSEKATELWERYEEALQFYETQRLLDAEAILNSLVQRFPLDRPSHVLLSRVKDSLGESLKPFDSVWTLTQK